jgi:hypothetical protein
MAFSLVWALFSLLWPVRGLGFVLFLPFFVLGLVAVARACDAIAALPHGASDAAGVLPRGGAAPRRASEGSAAAPHAASDAAASPRRAADAAVASPHGGAPPRRAADAPAALPQGAALPRREVRPPAAEWPVIHCISGELRGESVAIRPEGLIIGRNPAKAQLVLSDPQVSNVHARLWCDAPGAGVWLQDDSRYGTYYLPSPHTAPGARWARVPGRVLLSPRARFRLGERGAEFEIRRE